MGMKTMTRDDVMSRAPTWISVSSVSGPAQWPSGGRGRRRARRRGGCAVVDRRCSGGKRRRASHLLEGGLVDRRDHAAACALVAFDIGSAASRTEVGHYCAFEGVDSGARFQRSSGTARTSSAVARSTTPPTALTRALCILALYQRPASDAEKRTYSASSASSSDWYV